MKFRIVKISWDRTLVIIHENWIVLSIYANNGTSTIFVSSHNKFLLFSPYSPPDVEVNLCPKESHIRTILSPEIFWFQLIWLLVYGNSIFPLLQILHVGNFIMKS